GAINMTAGQCSNALNVQAQDYGGVPQQVTGDSTITLSSSDAVTGAFYLDPACATQIFATTISAGNTNSSSFYYGDTLAGSATLSANGGGPGLGFTSMQMAVQPGALSYKFLGGSLTVAAGACTAGPVIEAQDTFGNPALAVP